MSIELEQWNGTAWDTLIGGTAVEAPFLLGATKPVAGNVGPRQEATETYSGTWNVSGPTVIEGYHITGRVVVLNAASGDVIIRDCVIDASSLAASTASVISVQVNTAANVLIEHCEIIGQVGMIGIGVRRFTARRNHIHHVEDGIRCNNYQGTGQPSATVIEGNLIGPLITKVPDPNQTRNDNRTHSDCIQVEGGDGIVIVGNTLDGMNTTDGTSDLFDFDTTVSPARAVAPGEGDRAHPQALSCVLLNPGVSAITNITISENWFQGAAIALNAGASTTGTTGVIDDNRFDRDQWYASPQIAIDAASTSLTTSGNVFKDNAAAAAVARNW